MLLGWQVDSVRDADNGTVTEDEIAVRIPSVRYNVD